MAEPAPNDGPPEREPGTEGRIARLRARGEEVARRGEAWLERRRTEAMPVDLAVEYYERDRDAFASVLGAAIALRLFLFFVPAMLLVTGILMLVVGHDGVRSIAEQGGVTGGLANQVEEATTTSRTTTLGLLVAALWLTVWGGRSLTKVLAACSAGAWRMTGRQGRATFRMAVAVTTLIFLFVIVAGVMNRLRETQGLAVITTSWLLVGALYAVAWFLVSATLPRTTSDPGALLPGALGVGAGFAALQWFMQYYLPTKLAHSTALAGSIGASVAALGYMFFLGRIMASSFILDAVVYERLGSVSHLFFSLPVLRALPRRFPSLARYFDLDRDGEQPP